MNQVWKQKLVLKKNIIDKCNMIKPIDIVVGILCKNVESTVLNVLNVVNEGLYRYYPDYRLAIIVSDGHSTDKTREAIDLFQPYDNIDVIITEDITNGGKGAGVRTIFEIGKKRNKMPLTTNKNVWKLY